MMTAQLSTPSPMASAKPSSGFPIVNKITAAIEAQIARDYAPSDMQARIIVYSVAEENGFFNIWGPEERALTAALRRLSCGPRSAHYGWRLYARYRQRGELGPEGVRYEDISL